MTTPATPAVPQPGGGATGAELGRRAAKAGASATEADTGALLDRIRKLEEKDRASNAPEVVRYAQAAAAHVAAKAASRPDIAADTDNNFAPVTHAAADLVSAATDTAESGGKGAAGVRDAADTLSAWLDHHVGHFPTLDYSYVREMAAATAAAADRLAGKG